MGFPVFSAQTRKLNSFSQTIAAGAVADLRVDPNRAIPWSQIVMSSSSVLASQGSQSHHRDQHQGQQKFNFE
jgi:hypothetical protein